MMDNIEKFGKVYILVLNLGMTLLLVNYIIIGYVKFIDIITKWYWTLYTLSNIIFWYLIVKGV